MFDLTNKDVKLLKNLKSNELEIWQLQELRRTLEAQAKRVGLELVQRALNAVVVDNDENLAWVTLKQLIE
jgi:hypothetical protein